MCHILSLSYMCHILSTAVNMCHILSRAVKLSYMCHILSTPKPQLLSGGGDGAVRAQHQNRPVRRQGYHPCFTSLQYTQRVVPDGRRASHIFLHWQVYLLIVLRVLKALKLLPGGGDGAVRAQHQNRHGEAPQRKRGPPCPGYEPLESPPVD